MSFSISNQTNNIFIILQSKLETPLTKDLDYSGNKLVDVNSLKFVTNDGSSIVTEAGSLTLYANDDDTFYFITSGGANTKIGQTFDQSLNTTDSVTFNKLNIVGGAFGSDGLEFTVGAFTRFRVKENNSNDNLEFNAVAGGNALTIDSATRDVVFTNELTAKGDIVSAALDSDTTLDISASTKDLFLGNTSTPSVNFLGELIIDESVELNMGEKITISLQAGASLLANRVVKIDSNGKVNYVLPGDDDDVGIIGTTGAAANLDDPVPVVIMGDTEVFVEGVVSVSIGDFLVKSNTEQGTVTVAGATSTNIIGVATSAGTGGKINMVFSKI